MKFKFELTLLLGAIVPPIAAASPQELPPQLSCAIVDHEGKSLGTWIIQANEAEGSITIYSQAKFPATFSDSLINWKAGIKGNDTWIYYNINRYTGEFSAGTLEFPRLQTGVCTPSAKRLF